MGIVMSGSSVVARIEKCLNFNDQKLYVKNTQIVQLYDDFVLLGPFQFHL